ncbi:MAG: hypothetical protein ABI548_07380 [Polyangiaceae bacterium]
MISLTIGFAPGDHVGMTMMGADADRIDSRIKLLEEFLDLLRQFESAKQVSLRSERAGRRSPDAEQSLAALQSQLNRRVEAVGKAVSAAGVGSTLVYTAPAMIGGGTQVIDVFENVFGGVHDHAIMPHTITQTERAIGAYEAMRVDPTLFAQGKQALDIVDALNRSLRPAFREVPRNERDVQDAVDQILRVLGLDYVRDKEVAPVGPTSFKPDFTVGSLDLAIEVKFANEKHTAADVQRELAEDVTAYKTKWKHLIAVVYDLGVIQDPEQMRRDNEAHFGVTVVIVKH